MTLTAAPLNSANTEPGFTIPEVPSVESDSLFCIPLTSLPDSAVPIFDERTGACIGYSDECTKGGWRIYNSFGEAVGMEELPLGPSPIGPEDVFLLGLTLFKIGRIGWTAAKAVGTKGASMVGVRFAGMLRGRLLAPSAQQLKFSETAAKHMLNPGRYVPIHIQRLAIKYGNRVPDPQGVAGQFMYKSPMIKLTKRVVKGEVEYARVTRTLEVLVRESDWTITHFKYF